MKEVHLMLKHGHLNEKCNGRPGRTNIYVLEGKHIIYGAKISNFKRANPISIISTRDLQSGRGPGTRARWVGPGPARVWVRVRVRV